MLSAEDGTQTPEAAQPANCHWWDHRRSCCTPGHRTTERCGPRWPAAAGGRCRKACDGRQRCSTLGHPLPVVCGEAQVVELFRWLDGLPNTERVSVGCERQLPETCQQAR